MWGRAEITNSRKICSFLHRQSSEENAFSRRCRVRPDMRDLQTIRFDESGTLNRLSDRYLAVRHASLRLCAPLTVEDHALQAMPDASPAKWHLAHTTWFFETFLLSQHLPGYAPVNPAYRNLFNSYYNAVGERPLRAP